MLSKFKPTRNKITPCTRLSPVKGKRQTIPRRHPCVGNSASGDQTRKGTERKQNIIFKKQTENPFSRASYNDFYPSNGNIVLPKCFHKCAAHINKD